MRSRVLSPIAAVTVVLVVAGAALAGNLSAHTSAFNPGGLDITLASARVAGAGNPDATAVADPQNFGFVLASNQTTAFPPGASADITIKGFGPSIDVSSAGWDFLAGNPTGGSYCQGGSPRINLEDADGDVTFLDCDSVPSTDLGNGWRRVDFTVSPLLSPPAGGMDVVFIQLLHDEGPGAAVIDNIQINDEIITT